MLVFRKVIHMYKMNDAEVSFWNFSGHQNDIAPKTYLSMNGNTIRWFYNDNKQERTTNFDKDFLYMHWMLIMSILKNQQNIV